MRVFVIPEDFRKDQYILKPVFERMLKHLDKKRARVRVCHDPHLGGVSEAMKWENLQKIIADRKGMYAVILLVVDRDGKLGRAERLANLEAKARDAFGAEICFIATQAIEECETWLLGGLPMHTDWVWKDVRAETNPKEAYFEPYARERGLSGAAGDGREPLAREVNYKAMRDKCPELQEIERRITACMVAP